MRKPTGSGFEWAECLLIIGMGYWVQVFSLILNSSFGLSVGIQSSGKSVTKTLGSNPAFSRIIQPCLLSIRKSLACARALNLTTNYIHNKNAVATITEVITHARALTLFANPYEIISKQHVSKLDSIALFAVAAISFCHTKICFDNTVSVIVKKRLMSLTKFIYICA